MTQQDENVELRVSWGRCTGAKWCQLNRVDLTGPAFASGGVYIIWHGGENARAVHVGQAKSFRDRLADHRNDVRIQAYESHGLYVTWAVVDKNKRDGVENYLTARYRPLVGERRPDAAPIKVNSPWD
jgi:hypothetical protein